MFYIPWKIVQGLKSQTVPERTEIPQWWETKVICIRSSYDKRRRTSIRLGDSQSLKYCQIKKIFLKSRAKYY